MQKKFIFFISALLLALNFFCWQEVFVLAGPQKLRVDFFSVGQGDSEFIETPGGNKILIDGGPDATVLQKLAENMPFWDREIDLVILTHAEKDHMTGILDVLKKFHVDYFLWSGVSKDDAESKQLLALLENAQKPRNNFLAALPENFSPTKVIAVSTKDKVRIGDVSIDILFPLQNVAGKKLKENASANEACVVNKITYGKESFLFTGDIDSAVEKQLTDSKENLASNVLKVAHHGSKYSTSDLFLQNVKPNFAVIEVGKNSYGHPTEEVLNRLQNFGIKIFRTDKDGDVKFLSDGNNIYIN